MENDKKELTQDQVNDMNLGQIVNRMVSIKVELHSTFAQPQSSAENAAYLSVKEKELEAEYTMYEKALEHKETVYKNSSNIAPF